MCIRDREKYPDAYLVAEVFSDMAVYEKYYDSGIDSLFDFDFANKDGIIAKVVKGNTPASFYSQRLQEIEGIFSAHNKDYIDAPFYTNHDMGRSAGYYAGAVSYTHLTYEQSHVGLDLLTLVS